MRIPGCVALDSADVVDRCQVGPVELGATLVCVGIAVLVVVSSIYVPVE